MNTTSLAFMTALAMSTSVSTDGLACAQLRDGPRGIVTEVVDGDTVLLDNGLKVRLIGMQAPKLPLGREGFETWPLAEDAQSKLADIVLHKNAVVRYGGVERDRHGRVLGHLFVGDDEVWAQRYMLEQGMARVYSFPDNRQCLDVLYDAEAKARAARVGIWAHPFYEIRQADKPDALASLEGRYELVEGRVLHAERAGSRIYLNFGRLWREDFTVVIDRAAQVIFEKSGVDAILLDDAIVRVRGWMDVHDGPRMSVTHPEQIEVLAIK